jgi:hypothetical protein
MPYHQKQGIHQESFAYQSATYALSPMAHQIYGTEAQTETPLELLCRPDEDQ